MADDLNKKGRPDRSRVNVSEAYEVKYWSRKFGVKAQELRDAVKAVGSSVEAVGNRLRKQR